MAKLDAEIRGTRLVEEELPVERGFHRLEDAVAGARADHRRERDLLQHEARAALMQIATNEQLAEMRLKGLQQEFPQEVNYERNAQQGMQEKLTLELQARAQAADSVTRGVRSERVLEVRVVARHAQEQVL